MRNTKKKKKKPTNPPHVILSVGKNSSPRMTIGTTNARLGAGQSKGELKSRSGIQRYGGKSCSPTQRVK